MSEDPQNVTVTHDPAAGTKVVRVSGDIDHENSPRLADALRVPDRAPVSRTVVDLSCLRFADSSVLHVLLQAQRAHLARGALMVVAGPLSDTVRRLFDVTGTAGYFIRTDDVHAALDLPVRPGER
ncbi:STAS domain-containing protein [Streptomyces sp. NPDC055722]